MTAQEHISKVARMLANQQADACGVDREDNWRLYGEEFIAATAEAMSSVLAHIDQQQAEIERLKTESEERLQNCAALVAEVERLRKDAERYQWLAEYLVSDDESYDDAIVAATTVKEVDSVIDNAMKGTS